MSNALILPSVNFVSYRSLKERFKGKSIAIVGSGPSCLRNKHSFIDSHDIVVRINNYKTAGYEAITGERTDVYYSFFGYSIKKTQEELIDAGVELCMCKCPNSRFESVWHRRNHKPLGNDFRYIYDVRKSWWFCDTYIPTKKHFMDHFELLGNRVPTTGFSCILDFMAFDCEIYLTGFDFFTSKIHDVTRPWRPGRHDDPTGHTPEGEMEFLKTHKSRFSLDRTLRKLLV